MSVWTMEVIGGGYAIRIRRDGHTVADLHDLALTADETHESLAQFIVDACNAPDQRDADLRAILWNIVRLLKDLTHDQTT